MDTFYLGVDGCRLGWIYSAIRERSVVKVGFAESIGSLWNRFKNAHLILIDIPIGLADTKTRGCDIEARKFLKPQSGSCVFPAPCRETLQAISYEDACAVNKRISGKKISRQTWNIVPKIREIDMLIEALPEARKSIRESHPEVCFRALYGTTVEHSKKTSEGILRRLHILKGYLDNVDEHALDALIRYRKNGASLDDILDSLVLGVTAQLAAPNLRTLPENPASDDKGLPMEIVYALSRCGTGRIPTD